MGKLNKQQDSDNEDRMDIEKPQPPAKRKLIKKKAEKPSAQQNQEQGASRKSKEKSLANSSIKKYSKLVNLRKDQIDLTEKQGIFKKVIQTLKGQKKVSRKQRKKQRVLIKKELRKELDQKLPVTAAQQNAGGQAMQEQKPIVRKEKFEEKKVVEEFKKNMGLKFSTLKNMLAQKATS